MNKIHRNLSVTTNRDNSRLSHYHVSLYGGTVDDIKVNILFKPYSYGTIFFSWISTHACFAEKRIIYFFDTEKVLWGHILKEHTDDFPSCHHHLPFWVEQRTLLWAEWAFLLGGDLGFPCPIQRLEYLNQISFPALGPFRCNKIRHNLWHLTSDEIPLCSACKNLAITYSTPPNWRNQR